jgi:ABC-2 type transport system ATP-binding protein
VRIGMKVLQVESLTKRYGSVTGVDDVSFAVEQGEIFGYLGPNGSGKTTTIRCMMGLLKPTHGGCSIFSERIRPGRATQHRRIGYLPGDFRFWQRLSARSALSMLAALGDNTEAKKRQEQLAERLELDLNRRVGDLSKGNRQKVGVIYAFGHRPDILILDEPTIGLDPLVRQTVLELIREAADDGATVLLSSHDLAEVTAVCGRAAILRQGRLVELASISKIVQEGQRRLKVWLIEGAPIPDLSINKPPQVRLIQKEPGEFEIVYQGSADPVLKWIAQLPVDRIATPQTSLEDAFIQYYRDETEQEETTS